jgi:predicted membrane protein
VDQTDLIWAVVVGLVAGVGDRPGFEPVERLLQFVFAASARLLVAPMAREPHHRPAR